MDKQIELFDQYLRGQLSELENAHFAEKLQSDAAFRESFELHRKAIMAIEFAAIKDKMADIGKEAQRSKSLNTRTLVALAASILFLVGAYVFTLNRVDEPMDYDQVFASIHFKDPGLPTLMGVAEHSEDLDDFMLAYKQNKYDEALVIGRALAAGQANSDTIQFYIAMSLFELGEMEESFEILSDLEMVDGPIGQKSEWYLYLIDLKNGDLQSAVAGIKLIAENPNHIFRMEAIEALDVLELSK